MDIVPKVAKNPYGSTNFDKDDKRVLVKTPEKRDLNNPELARYKSYSA